MELLRTDGTLIIDRDVNTKAELVEYCVANNISLYRANLKEANLEGANLEGAYLRGAYLYRANLTRANLTDADLTDADLRGANLKEANLEGADLEGAYLRGADLYRANLTRSDLTRANLTDADLRGADLRGADLRGADLEGAYLRGAYLRGADLTDANLINTKGLVKLMGVTQGNFYWKRFNSGLNNNGYQFKTGLNTLTPNEVFADDDRVLCSYPGFHFASKSWCDLNYGDRPLEAKIRIPEEAKINEPWATDGKASADMIEIIQVFDVATGEDVTDQYR